MPLNGPPTSSANHQDHAVAAAIGRLSAEFADVVRVPIISRVVLASRRDLSGVPDPALPELVERLARQRLLQSRADATRG
jgi:hypothetical protein